MLSMCIRSINCNEDFCADVKCRYIVQVNILILTYLFKILSEAMSVLIL